LYIQVIQGEKKISAEKKPMSKYKIIPEFVEILFVQIDE